MNILLKFFALLVFACSAQACPINPWYHVAMDYERFLAKADVAFLGKLKSYKKEGKYGQLATFTVIKGFKSAPKSGEDIVVKNHHNASCSRIFHPIDSAFYVFATKTQI